MYKLVSREQIHRCVLCVTSSHCRRTHVSRLIFRLLSFIFDLFRFPIRMDAKKGAAISISISNQQSGVECGVKLSYLKNGGRRYTWEQFVLQLHEQCG